MKQLEEETLLFVRSFLNSSYPETVKEAALFNLATLRSQTVFRLPSGHLMGWEGIMDRFGSCQGSCTHVWNYEMATPFLFGGLAQTMRDVEFNYATKENGLMNFRADLPLSEAAKGNSAAADGQMGCIMKMYREWQLSGDYAFLRKNWGQVKKVLSYAWTEKGWDGNQDGVMEGSQHNTMDVNYFGPNPQMGFWYMGALRAAEEMAWAMKDKSFAKKCRRLFEQGSRWMDEHLFNGEYYEHHITDPETFEFINMEGADDKIPAFQLGKGCLVDQLVGQYMAHICGLGYLGDKKHIHTTMESIMKYNYVSDFSRHFNNMRSYVMGEEAGLLMASWPKGRLEVPFPYFAEVMTGFEYCAAVGMIYEGMTDEALTCIRSIRDRFDGAKRNPFSEPECGHHYARSMASWASVIALSGFHYSAVDKQMQFTSAPGTYFWSNGYAWGMCRISDGEATLEVLRGTLGIERLRIGDVTVKTKKKQLTAGESETINGKLMRYWYFLLVCISLILPACHEQAGNVLHPEKTSVADWKESLQEKLPLLGHRNWIVVTDMAYPLQADPGIITLYAPETFGNVAAFVMDRIRRSEHVFAHIYQDREQLALTEELCPGVTAYRNSLSKVLDGSEKVTFLPHEELISKLDSVSKLYQVVVIKTALTLPYTSIFFELDCKYWDAVREVTVRKLSMDAVDNH